MIPRPFRAMSSAVLVALVELGQRVGVEQVGLEVVVSLARRLGQLKVGGRGQEPLARLGGVPGQPRQADRWRQRRLPVVLQRGAVDERALASRPPFLATASRRMAVAEAEATAAVLDQQARLLQPLHGHLGVHGEGLGQVAVHLPSTPCTSSMVISGDSSETSRAWAARSADS